MVWVKDSIKIKTIAKGLYKILSFICYAVTAFTIALSADVLFHFSSFNSSALFYLAGVFCLGSLLLFTNAFSKLFKRKNKLKANLFISILVTALIMIVALDKQSSSPWSINKGPKLGAQCFLISSPLMTQIITSKSENFLSKSLLKLEKTCFHLNTIWLFQSFEHLNSNKDIYRYYSVCREKRITKHLDCFKEYRATWELNTKEHWQKDSFLENFERYFYYTSILNKIRD